MSVHKHLIIRAEVQKPIVDPEEAKNWIRRLVSAIGMKLTKHGGPHCDYVEKENNYGIAAVAIIETSHISLHIWDQDDPPLAQIDIYSCSNFEPKDVVEFINEMNPTKINFKFLDRENNLESIPFEFEKGYGYNVEIITSCKTSRKT